MQSKKVFGGMLMILGTCVGAGMLAIPIVSAHESFRLSALLLIAAWLCMTVGAFNIDNTRGTWWDCLCGYGGCGCSQSFIYDD